jgi:hypothetical protein
MKAFKNHQIILMERQSSSFGGRGGNDDDDRNRGGGHQISSNQYKLCPKHFTNNKYQDMFCKTCHVMICRICSVFDHTGDDHVIVSLSEGRSSQQQIIEQKLSHLVMILESNQELLTSGQHGILQMDQEKSVIVQEMGKLYERLRHDLEERRLEVNEEIEMIFETKMRRVNEQKNRIDQSLKEREEILERVEEIIRGSDRQVRGINGSLLIFLTSPCSPLLALPLLVCSFSMFPQFWRNVFCHSTKKMFQLSQR